MHWLVILLIIFTTLTAQAQQSCLVADVDSGYIFEKENATTPYPPASLTKVMTLYLTFSALKQGWIKMEDPLPISEWAASQEPSNLDLVPGDTITVREAILALIIKSANDVAVVLGEALGGTEEKFATMMTQAAIQLGMHNTSFKNASGLHHPEQYSCAKDLAILTLALIKNYPEYYPLFATPSFTYHNREYQTHNHVLQDYIGAEGLKTGYISAVGYNIISTAKQNDTRLVGIVIGGDSCVQRDEKVKSLLDRAFNRARKQKQAVARGLVKPAFDPLHRSVIINNINMNVFAPQMKWALKNSLAQGHKYVEAQKNKPQLAQQQSPIDDNVIKSHWIVQVGAFQSIDAAGSMAQKAKNLLGSKQLVIHTPQKNPTTYRSQLFGFHTKEEARSACYFLQNHNMDCFVAWGQT
ncbi:MAG: D-alanyl-D-alanine carboxypeptidase [Alphaproteobacteria bacterium]|nr:D-alanyl-D-alanine carboxypeptidase [Alphaproteobacteria bacterium]